MHLLSVSNDDDNTNNDDGIRFDWNPYAAFLLLREKKWPPWWKLYWRPAISFLFIFIFNCTLSLCVQHHLATATAVTRFSVVLILFFHKNSSISFNASFEFSFFFSRVCYIAERSRWKTFRNETFIDTEGTSRTFSSWFYR